VDSGSIVYVDRNAYSVSSRLIGEWVEARLKMETVEIWYGGRMVEVLPRLRGRGKHRVDYRHIIDWLVRKPGAFENYRYRDELFPTSRFRMTWDALREVAPARANKLYLEILQLAAQEGEARVDEVLAFGNPGSGKTHLLSALGQELIRQGRRVAFTTCVRLVQDLLRAKQELRLNRAIKKLGYYEALVIDDIGYVQQSREEMEVLFTLLAERYERGSVLLTSNLPFSQWEAIFKDPMTTASAIDRLVHHSVILELNIPSYRMEQAKKKKAEEG